MDKKTADKYKKLGYTHWVTVPPPAAHEIVGWKPVTENKDTGKFHDVNGVEYDKARSLDDLPTEWPESDS